MNTKKIALILPIFLTGIIFGIATYVNFFNPKNDVIADNLSLDEQEATIRAIKKVKPAVVSIELLDADKITQGFGTGFFISADGMIVTNKHVAGAVDVKQGEYKITLNDDSKFNAKYIGEDLFNDLAILKIDTAEATQTFPYIDLGDSDKLEVGQTVIAIGNARGMYHNSVTKGIVSGIEREITAVTGTGFLENLRNVLQTDAEINQGNSGGPLINLDGEVIGINTAIDASGTSIGFAIPINDAREVINSAKENKRIIRPYLGVKYIMLNQEVADEQGLKRNSGAWIVKDYETGAPAVLNYSPAYKAGIQEGDIIFEVNAIPVTEENDLGKIIQNYKPGDKIGLKIQRGNQILIKIVTLEEYR